MMGDAYLWFPTASGHKGAGSAQAGARSRTVRRKHMVEGKVLRRAVFLDRDGTLNKDVGYVHRKEDWQWLPGVAEALKRLRAVGYVLVVVSNQSGIARGMYDREALRLLEEWVNAELSAKNAAIDAWYYCPHLPEITGHCECRKPEPGLLLQAARDLELDLANSWMIGDRVRDVQAGIAAGCQSILLHPEGSDNSDDDDVPDGVAVVPHLPAATVRILAPRMRQLRAARMLEKMKE